MESLIAAIGVAVGAIFGSIAAIISSTAARKKAEAELILAKTESVARSGKIVRKLNLRTPPRVVIEPVKKGTRGASLDYEMLARDVLNDEELVDEWLAGYITHDA